MKKFLIVPALLLAGSAMAQKGLHVGVRIQPQSTWLYNQDDSDEGPELDFKSSFGMSGGLEVGYHLTDGFGLGLGLLYSSHNQKYEGKTEVAGVTLSNEEAHTRLNHLKIPIMIQLNTDSEAGSMFSFFVGPQFNLLMGYKDKLTSTPKTGTATTLEASGTEMTTTYGSFSTKETLDASPYTKSQLGAVLGMGAQFKLADNLFLGVELRFDYLFGDAENKKAKVTARTINGVTDPTFSSYEVWNNTDSKYTNSTQPRDRAKTSAFSGGFGLTFKYVLPVD